jgi:hypothetical protein
MASPAGALAHYVALSALTGELREAAARGEWERLPDIQQRRAGLLEPMAAADAAATLDEAARQRKDRLIEQVLDDEAAVRELIQSHLAQMQVALRNGRQELRLLKEYRRNAT